ncbi:MAG: hypothetical protein OEZ32_08130 [Nitrospinota bacterium]|nr:hypothetical protein [Nitrospinota bacterium]
MRKALIWVLVFLVCGAVTADAAKLYPAPIFRWTKDNGDPAVGWKVHTYEAGTTTNKATYTDSAAGTPNANPMVLDSRGEAPIYFLGTYKLVIKDSSDVTQATYDNFGTGDAATSPVVNLVNNASFEGDANSDLLPDEWTVVKYDAGTSTAILISSTQSHASNAMKFQSLGDGGGTATQSGYSQINPGRVYMVSFSLLSSVVDVRNVVEVQYYTAALALVSSQSVYDESTANPTTMTLKQYVITVPATAKYLKIVLTGCHSSDPTPGYTLFDDVSVSEINHHTGTTSATFDINSDSNRGRLDSSGLTANRDYTLPDTAGTVALISDVIYPDAYNPIINGDMRIWQRGTSFTSIANGAYSADRWANVNTGAAVYDISRSPDVPTAAEAGITYQYSLHLDVTTLDSAIAAGDIVSLIQRIEGYNFAPFAGQTATLTFWVKATKPGTYCVSFTNSGEDRSYVAEYTIDATNTWEKKTIQLTFDYSGGTWNYTNGTGVLLSFTLAAGTTYRATAAGVWEAGNFRATSNQVNGVDSVSNDYRITDVNLYFGDAPTSPKPRTFNEELALCQRYYSKSFAYAQPPASNVGPGRLLSPATRAGALLNHLPSVLWPTPMRTIPTVTTYNPFAAGNQVRDETAGVNCSGTLTGSTETGMWVYATGNAATTVGNALSYQYTADAEL